MERRSQDAEGLRIGELAEASGLTVRALRYYEEIGLLGEPQRTQSGHRTYGVAEVERLYRINLLRRLGLSLVEIGRALDDPAWNLRATLGAHAHDLERRLDRERRLHGRLMHLLAALDQSNRSRTEELLTILEDMTMLDQTVQRQISTLVYSDIEAAHDHLERVFLLGPGSLTRDDDGRVVHAEIQVGDGAVWLHPESTEFDLSSPRALGAATATVSVMVDDVDAHFEHARSLGAEIVYEPVDQPYGYREYSARDPEGHLWSFMKAFV